MENRKYKIEYIRYYSPGSEALDIQPQLLPRPAKKKIPQAQAKPVPALVVSLDPLAALAICVAIVMAILMAVGFGRLQDARQELDQMAAYVQVLEQEHQELQAEFDSGFDAEAVEKAARALGMIPVEEVAHLQVKLDPEPVQEELPEGSFLDKMVSYLSGIFA